MTQAPMPNMALARLWHITFVSASLSRLWAMTMPMSSLRLGAVSLFVGGGEVINSDCGTEIGCYRSFLILQWDAGGIRHPVDGIEQSDHCSRIGQCGGTHGFGDFRPCRRQVSRISSLRRGGKAQQQGAIGDATARPLAGNIGPGHHREIVFTTVIMAART